MGICPSKTHLHIDYNDYVKMNKINKYIITDGIYVYDFSYLQTINHPSRVFRKSMLAEDVRRHMRFHTTEAKQKMIDHIIGTISIV